jgi:serine/threonine-protein kinase
MEVDSSQPFGKYTLIRRLAVGGMAEIFLAEHHGEAGFVRQVVIKRVLPNLSENPDFVTMFLDEARLLARLTHPNVVHIYDFGRIDDLYFLSLEYVHGGNLREVLIRQRGTPVPLGQALFVASQALAGLDHAHRARGPDGAPLRLVHRDISPSNILLSLEGAVKVADFGIARSTVQQVHTAAFVIKGKLAYMSPEQVTGRPLDGRSDLFSMGVVLFEMLTGRRLFSRESAGDIQRAICVEQIPPVLSLRPDLPQPVVDLIDRALQRDREDRFPSAAAMQIAVDECMATCRLVGGAQHLAMFMKQIFPELADEGTSLSDIAPTVMRDPGHYQAGTEILGDQSAPSTTPGMYRPAPPAGPVPEGPTALTPSGSVLASPPVEPRHPSARAMTPVPLAPPRSMTPAGVPPPRSMTPMGVVPRAVAPRTTPAPTGRPTSAPIPLPAEPHRSGPVSAPLNLPPSASFPVSAPLNLPPSASFPVSAPLNLPPSESFPVSAPLNLPPSAGLDAAAPETLRPVLQPLTPHPSSSFQAPKLAGLGPLLFRLREWLVDQWLTVAIGTAAVVIGTIALCLMFAGGTPDPGAPAPPDAVVAVDTGAATRPPVVGRDAGSQRDGAAPRLDAGARRGAAPARDAGAAAAAVDGGPGQKPLEPAGRAAHADSPGLLSIQARPSATALLDGRKIGETPIYRRRTPAGWHTLELRAQGQPSIKRRIHIQPSREFKRTYDLVAGKER